MLYSKFYSEISMARSTLAYLCALLLLGVAVKADEPEAIVGGQMARLGEFPYQVSLRVRGQHNCGGTLISNKHILTAAHCVYNIVAPPYDELTVVTGTTSIMSGGQTHTVKAVFYHSNYQNSAQMSFANDIALVTLHQPIEVNAYQRPIAVASSETPVGAQAILSGWGMIRANGPLSEPLLKASMTVISNQECQSTHRERIYDTQICGFQQVGVGACQGDSGGPLVFNNEVIGVVSWVYPCGIGVPDVYTRVLYYRDFINEAIQQSG